jgi:hypothetical protein
MDCIDHSLVRDWDRGFRERLVAIHVDDRDDHGFSSVPIPDLVRDHGRCPRQEDLDPDLLQRLRVYVPVLTLTLMRPARLQPRLYEVYRKRTLWSENTVSFQI